MVLTVPPNVQEWKSHAKVEAHRLYELRRNSKRTIKTGEKLWCFGGFISWQNSVNELGMSQASNETVNGTDATRKLPIRLSLFSLIK